jgi:DNA-binding FrmR family transcriptional regulator
VNEKALFIVWVTVQLLEDECGRHKMEEQNETYMDRQECDGQELMTGNVEEGCCCHKKKERSDKELRDLLNRLSRIEGQIRGIRGMVEKDCYCPDIMLQVSAVNAALNSLNKVLLAEHIRTCVAEDIRQGKDETIDELCDTLKKLLK